MRRTDRLFKIIQRLRRRRATTASQLAEILEVSERTVYRDIRDLIDSGVPVRGEAGVGYLLDRTYDLPPLMFDEDEIEALVLGARIVQSRGDEALSFAATSILEKVEAVLPAPLAARIAASTLFALNLHREPGDRETLGLLRRAVNDRHKVEFGYRDQEGRGSSRVVRPLGLFYWGLTWTLAAWCELRRDLRNFRLDRMAELRRLDETFPLEPGRTLDDLFRRYREEKA